MFRAILFLFIVVLFLPLGIAQTPRGMSAHGIPIPFDDSQQKITTQGFYIGVDSCQDSAFKVLNYAKRDAQLTKDFFVSNDLYEHLPPFLLTNGNATKSNIIGTLEFFVAAEKIRSTPSVDRVILYFAGHGWVADGKTYLIPNTATRNLNWSTMINMDGLYDHIIFPLNAIGVEVLLVVDACYAGRFLFSDTNNHQPRKDKAATIKFLSSDPMQQSQESKKWNGGQGVFTYFFLKGSEGEADRNDDGHVDERELGRYLQDSVAERTNERQTPMFSQLSQRVYISKQKVQQMDYAKQEEETILNQEEKFARSVPIGRVNWGPSVVNLAENQPGAMSPLTNQKNTLKKESNSLKLDIPSIPQDSFKLNSTLQSDTFRLLNDLELFRNRLNFDPFNLPKVDELIKIKGKIKKLKAYGLQKYEFYKLVEVDELRVNGLLLFESEFGKNDSSNPYHDGSVKTKPTKSNQESPNRKTSPLAKLTLPSKIKSDKKIVHSKSSFQKKKTYLKQFDEILKNSPNDISTIALKANTYIYSDKNYLAISVLNNAIIDHPDYSIFYLARAWAYSKTQRHKKAINDLDTFYSKIDKAREQNMFEQNERRDWITDKQFSIIQEIKLNEHNSTNSKKKIVALFDNLDGVDFPDKDISSFKEAIISGIMKTHTCRVYNESEAIGEAEALIKEQLRMSPQAINPESYFQTPNYVLQLQFSNLKSSHSKNKPLTDTIRKVNISILLNAKLISVGDGVVLNNKLIPIHQIKYVNQNSPEYNRSNNQLFSLLKERISQSLVKELSTFMIESFPPEIFVIKASEEKNASAKSVYCKTSTPLEIGTLLEIFTEKLTYLEDQKEASIVKQRIGSLVVTESKSKQIIEGKITEGGTDIIKALEDKQRISCSIVKPVD